MDTFLPEEKPSPGALFGALPIIAFRNGERLSVHPDFIDRSVIFLRAQFDVAPGALLRLLIFCSRHGSPIVAFFEVTFSQQSRGGFAIVARLLDISAHDERRWQAFYAKLARGHAAYPISAPPPAASRRDMFPDSAPLALAS